MGVDQVLPPLFWLHNHSFIPASFFLKYRFDAILSDKMPLQRQGNKRRAFEFQQGYPHRKILTNLKYKDVQINDI